jgi:hypothetical protein
LASASTRTSRADLEENTGISLGRKSAIVLVHDGWGVSRFKGDPGYVPGQCHLEADGGMSGAVGDPGNNGGLASSGDGSGESALVSVEDPDLW